MLEDIIDWVNSVKVGNEPNVVLGQSMGGVIARYSLKDMEDNQIDHKTSLYISHDAPHQGANIPLGIQYFARHMIDQFVSTPAGDQNLNPNDGGSVTIEDLQTLLEAPGTKQLLSHTINNGFGVDNNSNWQNELELKGYPQQTRNIAISNGSHCANPQEYSPNSIFLQVKGEGKTSTLTDIIAYILKMLSGVATDIVADQFNSPAFLLGRLPGNSSFDMDFTARAFPSYGNSAQIYKGNLTYTKKLFWIANITVSITNESFNNPSGILPYDNYPAGLYSNPFNSGGFDSSSYFGYYDITFNSSDNFAFIPTPSALDVGGGSTVLNHNDYNRIYNAENPPIGNLSIPFQNFITAYEDIYSLNENHISFNSKNGNWLAKEINSVNNDEEVFNCSFMCDGTEISGEDIICSTGIFTIPDIPLTGTTVTWSVSPTSSLTLTPNNNNSVNVTKNPGYSGNVTLTAEITSDCGTISKPKTFWVGTPTVVAKLSNGELISHGHTNQVCKYQQMYTDMSINGQNTVTWQLLSSSHTTTWSQQGNNISFYLWAVNHTATFRFTTSNSCGTITRDFTFVSKDCSGGGGDPDPCDPPLLTYSVYPNPTSSGLEIAPTNPIPNIPAPCRTGSTKSSEDNGKFSGTPSIATLYDFNGNKVKTQIPAQGRMDVEDLKEGHYILVIKNGDNSESHHIIIE